jgi:hypothetical protein
MREACLTWEKSVEKRARQYTKPRQGQAVKLRALLLLDEPYNTDEVES